ncbi:MAG: hypothetical protein K6E64_09140 [Lachnospiraceae bacterium]|nr:hypothetical protein [Lachnospiraceae bacterium]
MSDFNGGDGFDPKEYSFWSSALDSKSGGGGNHGVSDEGLRKVLLIVSLILIVVFQWAGLLFSLPLLYIAWVTTL